MNDVLDHDQPSLSRGDRELTLGTGTILGIFLALIVLCGACFGGGYVMGHKSQPAPLTLADTSADAANGSNTAKPAAGSPVDPSNPSAPLPSVNTMAGVTVAPASATPAPRPVPIIRRPPPPPPGDDTADASDAGSRSAKITGSLKAPSAKAVPPGALLPSASPAAPGFIMVQVAAVSHQEDADLLIGALRGRGYAVMARKGTGDPLIHVQVGPFSNKPAAEAMRQKLMGDGYNAMLKY